MGVFVYAALTLSTGYLVSRLLEKSRSSMAHIILFGFGVVGLLYFWHVLIVGQIQVLAFVGSLVLVMLLLTLAVRSRGHKILVPIEISVIDLVVLGVIFLIATDQIYGQWDAWATFNPKARFLSSGEHWKQMFSPTIIWMVPDYPLLLPSVIAAGWTISGSTSPWIPSIISVLFSWSLYLLLTRGLASSLSWFYGALGGLLLLCVPAFVDRGTSQYADMPIAAYLLLGVMIIHKDRSTSAFGLSGFALGLVAFTKNEGLLYVLLLILSVIYACWYSGQRMPKRSVIVWVAALVPGIGSNLIVKGLAPINVQLRVNILEMIPLIPARGLLIVEGFLEEFLYWRDWMLFWPLAILLCVLMRPRNRSRDFWDLAFTAFLCLSLVSFIGVYLLTPHPVEWHIKSSFDRLLIQILPIFIFLLVLRLREFWKDTAAGEALDEGGIATLVSEKI